MFGCLPLLLHLCMLIGRKVHFTKVCRFPAALGDISGTRQPDPVSAARSRNQRPAHAALGSRTGRAEGRSPFKNIYNEGLASGACRRRLADTGVTAPVLPCRLTLLLPDASISLSVCLRLSQEANARHESQDAGLINFAYSPRTRAQEKETARLNMCDSVGGHK